MSFLAKPELEILRTRTKDMEYAIHVMREAHDTGTLTPTYADPKQVHDAYMANSVASDKTRSGMRWA